MGHATGGRAAIAGLEMARANSPDGTDSLNSSIVIPTPTRPKIFFKARVRTEHVEAGVHSQVG